MYFQKEIDFLRGKHINVGLLSRSSKEKERYNILKDLTSVSPKIVLLYVTTEMNTLTYFKVKYFKTLTLQCKINFQLT